ncbi:MAG TPA: AAA family ATPase [Planctomycetaceae bacterium]|nr:AAA family ATPase [Planctomycetaceae bacterium]
MYEQHWGLGRAAFRNTAEPEFFFRSATHQAALLKLRYATENRLGACLLAGGVGYGKSFTTAMLAHDLGETCRPAVHVRFPQLTPAELLSHLAIELASGDAVDGGDLPVDFGERGLDATVRAIGRQLRRHADAGRRPLVIVDDAHLIGDLRVFQTLQLLLNFQHERSGDFTLVLVGERTLLGRIGRIPQLNDRIGIKALLRPLSQEETAGYVAHRLEVAGTGETIFDGAALDSLFEQSGGVPRKINRLCDLALLVAYSDGLRTVTPSEVEAVVDELVAAVQ